MKKISLIVLTLCVSTAIFAQETQPQLVTPMSVKTRFGLRAGANLANVRLNEFAPTEPDVKQKTSFHVGAFVNIPISPMFRFQPEVEYSGQGSKVSKYRLTDRAVTTAYEQDLSYVNVPLMLQFMTRSGFMIEAGPQAGWLLNASQDGPGDTDTDNHKSFDKFNVSVGAGLGYLSRIGLGVNARYNFGLTNTLEDDNGTSNNGPEVKNQVFQIGLVYQFGAGR